MAAVATFLRPDRGDRKNSVMPHGVDDWRQLGARRSQPAAVFELVAQGRTPALHQPAGERAEDCGLPRAADFSVIGGAHRLRKSDLGEFCEVRLGQFRCHDFFDKPRGR